MSTSEIDALQGTLAAEHAAIFVLGALGGRASTLEPSAFRAAVDAAYQSHVERRDQLRTMLGESGAVPVAADPAYRLARPLTTAAQIAAEAVRIQRACATTYAALVAATTGTRRGWAITALVGTAVSEVELGGRPQPLPGLGGA